MGLSKGPAPPTPAPRKAGVAGTRIRACGRPLVPPDRGGPPPGARWTRPGGLLAPAVGRPLAAYSVRRARSQAQCEDQDEALSPRSRLRLPPEERLDHPAPRDRTA